MTEQLKAPVSLSFTGKIKKNDRKRQTLASLVSTPKAKPKSVTKRQNASNILAQTTSLNELQSKLEKTSQTNENDKSNNLNDIESIKVKENSNNKGNINNSNSNDSNKLEIDIDNLPDAPTIDEFEEVPIETFGVAMLKGMGWNPDDASSKFNYNNQTGNNIVPRPKGLGLGAKFDMELLKVQNPKKYKKMIENQKQFGEYIETESEKQAKRDQLKQALKERKRKARLEQEYNNQYNANNNNNDDISSPPPKKRLKIAATNDNTRNDYNSNEISKSYYNDKNKNNNNNNENYASDNDSDSNEMREKEQAKYRIKWVSRGLRVRIITKKFGSKYYEQKGTVFEIESLYEFTVKMDGNGLNLLKCCERDVESVIPKVDQRVKILTGKYRGQTATIKKKQRDQQAICTLDSNLKVVTMYFDDICAFES